jgi:hypothetical protein
MLEQLVLTAQEQLQALQAIQEMLVILELLAQQEMLVIQVMDHQLAHLHFLYSPHKILQVELAVLQVMQVQQEMLEIQEIRVPLAILEQTV